MDEELAEAAEAAEAAGAAEAPRPRGRPVRPVSEMTPEVQLLTTLVQLTQNLLQQKSKKRLHFPPLPMPRTARQILAERRRRESRQRITDRITEAQQRWTATADQREDEDPDQDPAASPGAADDGVTFTSQ